MSTDRAVVLELRPTGEVVTLPDAEGPQRVRRWVGETADGIVVDLYVAVVRVEEIDVAAFEVSPLGKALETRSSGELPEAFHRRRRNGGSPDA